jgi:hypothetical protein
MIPLSLRRWCHFAIYEMYCPTVLITKLTKRSDTLLDPSKADIANTV